MNLCDNPTEVSVGSAWLEDHEVPRVPIIVTANDLSTMYAPLLRDGRMDKFYWEPDAGELAEASSRAVCGTDDRDGMRGRTRVLKKSAGDGGRRDGDREMGLVMADG